MGRRSDREDRTAKGELGMIRLEPRGTRNAERGTRSGGRRSRSSPAPRSALAAPSSTLPAPRSALPAPRSALRAPILGLYVVWLLALAAGCDPPDIDRAYGKRRGAAAGSSVNGTAVLAEMFERADYRVVSWRRLSPKLGESDVIVWAPDDFQPPTVEQRAFLEQWLSDQSGRTLVYIGRDYDAAITYWRTVYPSSPADQAMEVSRRLAAVQAEYDAARAKMPEKENCDWFTVRRDGARRKVDGLAGPWSAGIDAAKVEIEIAGRLDVPGEVATDKQKRGDANRWHGRHEPLLVSGDDVLVMRVSRVDWNRSKIIVAANGSFLLNLPLVNHEHRKLAGKLISECGQPGRVTFLESGPGGPRIYDEEPDTSYPTGFEAFTVWPLGIIVLHLTALGIALCVVLFPIFGRARDVSRGSTADFGKHIEALGELLELTRDHQYALHRIKYYHEHVKRESGVSHRKEK